MESEGGGKTERVLPVEHQLTMHLERACELADRLQRSNDIVKQEITRALEIADRIGHLDEHQ